MLSCPRKGFYSCIGWVVVDDLTHQQCNISTELAQAQSRLLALRGNILPAKQKGADDVSAVNAVDVMAELPAHLGWHSQPFTKVVRQTTSTIIEEGIQDTIIVTQPTLPSPTKPHKIETISLYPDLAIKILQDGSVATARIWLLLQHLDQLGRGCLEEAVVRSQLCNTDSNLRVCGWRQLRKLFGSGEGVFWERSNGKIWLRSPIKVAKQFGVERFMLRAIKLPIKRLYDPIGKVRAHFYASFHSSRVKENISAPISRETLSHLTSLSRPTQRTYEKLAGISCQTNICISEVSTPARKKQLASEHGHALFEFTDHRGKMGKSGTTYLAWQLPNSYGGCHELLAKGHQKRLNRQLADLFGIGMTGNGKERQRVAKRFFNNGAMASHQAGLGEEIYWQAGSGSGKMGVWHGMPA